MRTLGLLVAGLLLAGTAWSGTVYDNFTSWTDWGPWPFGYPNTATFGQTFTAPTNEDTNLQSFVFRFQYGESGPIRLGAYIATWTGTHAGTLLFSSPQTDFPNPNGVQQSELTFATGGLQLTGGASYIAFLSILPYYGQSSGQAEAVAGNSSIPGGGFVYANLYQGGGGSWDNLFAGDWETMAGWNWSVRATFDAPSSPGEGVPEPATAALVGLGLIGIAAVRRKLSR
jgi:hypothetical protein